MRTRAMEGNNIVWFGSAGKNPDGTAKLVYNQQGLYSDSRDLNKKISEPAKETLRMSKFNFSTEQIGVRDSLVQRLSVLKGELWYRVNYGIPLFDKVHSKTLIDTQVASVVTSHEDVIRIEKFESSLYNHKYSCNMTIVTVFGNLDLEI